MCYTVNSEQLNPVNTYTNTSPGVNICSHMATCWQKLKQCVLLWGGSRLKSTRSCEAALKHTARNSGTTEPLGTTVLGQVLEWS